MDNSKEVYFVPTNESSPPPKDKENALLQFIREMLMGEDEDLSNQPSMLHHGLALQATEKSLHDALHNINLDTTCGNSDSESLIGSKEMVSESSRAKKTRSREHHRRSNKQLANNTAADESELLEHVQTKGEPSRGHGCKKKNIIEKKTRSREDSDLSEHHRSNKQLANNNDDDNDESDPLEMYEDVLLSSKLDIIVQTLAQTKGKPSRGDGCMKKNIAEMKLIDLRSLLMQCAQAVENFDHKTLNDILWQIRKHASPKGDDMERLAHYFASALEARLAGTGTELYAALNSERISAAEILKAYKMYVVACPFRQMSNLMANWTISDLSLATRATTLHVIDFGILYGLQWPCLIHGLSERTGRPLFFRITAIDFPQPGLRPAERVVDTCRRLAKWADRFGVPFEYDVIAQKWDTVELEDLKIEKNELLVVNCMYRLHNVPDESETGNSPRDAVLNLIKKINPHLFVHGVANGTHSAPFFVPRFKEAFFHFTSLFDMLDATMPQDDEDRLLYEKQFFGKEIMNIIACEGTERVERPEKYTQWQRRIVRAGFRQVPIDQRIVKKLKKVKTGYHKSFSVDEEGEWVLLGWKGRVIQGFSCWRPTHNRSSSQSVYINF